MLDRARQLFELIKVGGVDQIKTFISTGHSEDLFIDYKLSADGGAKLPALHSNDKKNYGKAISGFGNSEGGIIVWGVRCQKAKDGYDVPSGIQEIHNCKVFATALDSCLGSATIPIHTRVENAALPTSGDSGLVVTFIPRSYPAPHQLAADSRYYIRAGSSFVPASHHTILGLLDRRPVPEPFLKLVCSKPSMNPDSTVEVRFGLSFLHEGPGLLEDCYISLTIFRLPGESCGFRMVRTEDTRWIRSLWLLTRFSAILNSPIKLAPFAADQPFVFSMTLAGDINQDFEYEIAFGAKGTPVKLIHAKVPRQNVAAALATCRNSQLNDEEGFRLVDDFLGMDQWPQG